MDWVQNGVIGKSRTLGDNFGHFSKISSPIGRGVEEKIFLMCFVAKWQTKQTYILFKSALSVGTKPKIEEKMYIDVSTDVE